MHLEERLTVSQSVPEPASRQSDRYTQFGFFVSSRYGAKQKGALRTPGSSRVVTQPTGVRVVGGSDLSLPILAPPPAAALKFGRLGFEPTPAHPESVAVTIGPLTVVQAPCVLTACSLLSKNF